VKDDHAGCGIAVINSGYSNLCMLCDIFYVARLHAILTFTETSKFAIKDQILTARVFCVLFLLVFTLEEADAELPRTC
jgi:hypothetical protein